MRAIKTDLGTEYINKIITELCLLLKIEHHKSTAYHHETVGGVERNHRLLNEYLRSYLNGNLADWDTYLRYFTFCYNITQSTTNDSKYSPFELIFGKNATMPNEILNGQVTPIYNIDNYISELKHRLQSAHLETQKIINKIKERNKIYHSKTSNPIDVRVGDKIKVINEPYNKHNLIYSGPFSVTEIQDKNVVIDLNGKKYTIHKNRILKY